MRGGYSSRLTVRTPAGTLHSLPSYIDTVTHVSKLSGVDLDYLTSTKYVAVLFVLLFLFLLNLEKGVVDCSNDASLYEKFATSSLSMLEIPMPLLTLTLVGVNGLIENLQAYVII